MVSPGRVLLVVAADRREFAAVLAGGRFHPVDCGVRWAAEGFIGERRALLVANGAGRLQAAGAVELACQFAEPDAIVSTGFAGATRPGWRLGEGVAVSRVLQPGVSLEYAVKLPGFLDAEPLKTGTLVTIDRVAQSPEDKRCLAEMGADLVDMEASAVAQAAQLRGVSFYCVRAVSDLASEHFPIDFNRALRKDGSFSVPSIVWQAGLRPARWRALLRLQQNAAAAAATLSSLLHTCQFPA